MMTLEKTIISFFKEAWRIFSNNFVALILGFLISVIGSILIITAPPLFYGFNMLCVDLSRGKKVKASDVFKGFNFFLRSWALALLALLAILVGFVLLIIPGILLIIMFQYAVYLSITKNLGAYDSLIASYELSKKHFALTIVLFILIMILNGLGGALKVGNILTAPFASLVLAVTAKNIK